MDIYQQLIEIIEISEEMDQIKPKSVVPLEKGLQEQMNVLFEKQSKIWDDLNTKHMPLCIQIMRFLSHVILSTKRRRPQTLGWPMKWLDKRFLLVRGCQKAFKKQRQETEESFVGYEGEVLLEDIYGYMKEAISVRSTQKDHTDQLGRLKEEMSWINYMIHEVLHAIHCTRSTITNVWLLSGTSASDGGQCVG